MKLKGSKTAFVFCLECGKESEKFRAYLYRDENEDYLDSWRGQIPVGWKVEEEGEMDGTSGRVGGYCNKCTEKIQDVEGALEEDPGEVETRNVLAEGQGITFESAQEAIKWLKSDDISSPSAACGDGWPSNLNRERMRWRVAYFVSARSAKLNGIITKQILARLQL